MPTKTVTNSEGTFTVRPGSRLDMASQPALPTVQPTAPIPVTSLQNPPAPYAIPPANTQPTTSTLALTNSGMQSALQADSTIQPPNQNPDKLGVSALLKQTLGDVQGVSAATDKIRAEADIYNKKQKATAVANQLDQMDKAYRDEVNQIRKNAAGGFGGAVEQQIQEATDKYENNRANVALTYKVLAGDYNDAQQIVNDKVQSLQTQIGQKIQLYQLAAAAINNDLTDSEKLIVSDNLARKRADADAVRETYSTTLTNAVLNGASASVLAAIDAASRQPGATAASILAAAGRYAQDPVEMANLANINSQIAARNTPAGGGTLNGKPQTAAQSQIQGYADRTNEANQVIDKLGAQFASTAIGNVLGTKNPTNFFKSSDRQQFEQAQRNFINAVLRRESGAVIADSEFDNAAKQYFPQPGDSSEVLTQKAANRQTVINSLYQQSNINRPALPGQIIEGDDGKTYKIADDGETLIPQ